MLLLKVREKTGVKVSLETIAKAAGINASFVLKMDMTLYLPVCASLSHNYIKDVESFAIFSDDDAARKLAQQTLNLIKERSWRLHSRLESKYKRTVTNVAETFIPARFVADKSTHLGRPWKPVAIDSHERKMPQTIIVEVAQSLDWDNFEKIGQPPQAAD
jgi:hypothetical protein